MTTEQSRYFKSIGANIEPDNPSICVWEEDYEGTYHTSCSKSFILNDETPSDNDMHFCCYCGKELKARIYKE